MKNTITVLLFIALTCFFAFFYFQPQPTESLLANSNEGLFNLEAHWAQGNVVSLIRHAERCDRSNNKCLEGETGITIFGMEEATKLGNSYRNLPTQDVVIYNSPVKRTVQSAKFIFGESSSTKKWLREGCKENLIDNIFKYKEQGKNLILVTHSTCIDALGEKQGNKLFKMEVHGEDTYGTSFFIATDLKRKRIHVLGYLYAHDWQQAYNSL